MTNRVTLLTLLPLLLIATVGCPHAWGRNGTIEQALERDVSEYYSLRDCTLDKQEWFDLCATFYERESNSMARQLCPPECRPSRPPGNP
ncbi:hypothetical protein [Archangium lansingense]|uniref:Lipoprotein n=1 Tax=Archangium lansingense TaxID=2995310 RepID=A0ABT4ALW8_9BACT|nr:hypothetical protein [Archangium lansinium]MCY1082693.1 hypothetical protein [Archangium lansinium]